MVATMVTGLIAGPRYVSHGYESKIDITRLTVEKYVAEAYPAWRRDHPDRMCPEHVLELDLYMDKRDPRDAWGHSYVFTCDSRGLSVMSVGADGLANTLDDVRSREERARW